MNKPILAAAACALVAAAAGAQASQAAVVKQSPHGLLLVEPVLPAPLGQPKAPDPGENNTITITQNGSAVVVSDSTAPLTVSGPGCTLTTAPGALPSSATCTGPITHISASGGNGNDSITNATSLPAMLDGGKGDDVLHAGTGADTLVGSAGTNKLYAGPGADTVYTQGRGSNYATSKAKSSVFCVAGSNTTVYATAGDTVAAECKNVVRAQATAGQTPTPAPASGGSGGTAPSSTGAGATHTPVTQTRPGQTAPSATAPVAQPTAPRSTPAGAPRLRLLSARVFRRVLRVRGAVAPQAAAPVRISISAPVGRRTVTVSRALAVNHSAGTFALVMRLGPRLRRARHLAIIVHYPGDRAFTAQTLRRTIAVR
jgi:hypothetical protein